MSKSLSHWYPRYPADYGKKTRHLSLMEHGAYALMMDYCYSTGNPLPANAVQLHRICMAFEEAEQEACSRVLHEFFVEGPGGWSNPRIDQELKKRNEISDKRANAARSMHEKKAASADANAPAIAHTSTATSNIEKKEEADASSKPKKSRGSRLSEDWFLPMEWGNYSLEKGMSHEEIMVEAEKFRNYWTAKSGNTATKVSWEATWHNWTLNFIERRGPKNGKRNHHQQQLGLAQGQPDRIDPALENIARIVGLGQA